MSTSKGFFVVILGLAVAQSRFKHLRFWAVFRAFLALLLAGFELFPIGRQKIQTVRGVCFLTKLTFRLESCWAKRFRNATRVNRMLTVDRQKFH